MTRKHISSDVVDSVLLSSRRRCCICFGLNRDTSQKKGQIAHLDHNNANASLENLAYLCIDHHDEYDSRTSQSKGLTLGEVKQFRSELRNAVSQLTSQSIVFGSLTLDKADPYVGHYVREDSDITWSAEIDIASLPDSIEGQLRYFVSGFAIFGGHRELGPNTGTLEFFSDLSDGVLRQTFYTGDHRDYDPHIIILTFSADGFTIGEENYLGRYGMNVSFQGNYVRGDKITYSDWYWQNEEARQRFSSNTIPE